MDQQRPIDPNRKTISMPASTFWPMVFAFGIMLLMAGLLTNIAVSVVGLAIFVRATYGWWREVIPVERHEEIEVLRELRAQPVVVTGRTVAHLKAGAQQHRVRIPETIHPYSAGLWGGLAGGAAMAVMAALWGLVIEHSIWYPINLLAAGVFPSLATASVEELKAFHAIPFLGACVLHGIFSILVGVLYAVMLPMFPKRAPLWAGLMAPLLWSGMIAASLELLNPVLEARIRWPWFVACQIGFGAVAGFVIAKTERIETMQSWSFEARSGVEAPGMRPPKEPGAEK